MHHTYCGATSFTIDGIIDAYNREHNAEIAALYERASISIGDLTASLKRDAHLRLCLEMEEFWSLGLKRMQARLS